MFDVGGLFFLLLFLVHHSQYLVKHMFPKHPQYYYPKIAKEEYDHDTEEEEEEQPYDWRKNINLPLPKEDPVLNATNHAAKGRECLLCGNTEKLICCPRCKTAYYCSETCRVINWSKHKSYCL